MTQQNKYVLYLGLADKDTKKQQITTSKAMKLVNDVIDVLIKGIAVKEEENTKQFLQDFENTYKKLPDKVKQSLKNSDILLETEEQAKDLLQSMKLINAISEVL